MIGLSHAQRSNTLPPTIALLALGVWQCGAMLLFEKPANRWLLRPRVWLGAVVANSMVMAFYLWNMTVESCEDRAAGPRTSARRRFHQRNRYSARTREGGARHGLVEETELIWP